MLGERGREILETGEKLSLLQSQADKCGGMVCTKKIFQIHVGKTAAEDVELYNVQHERCRSCASKFKTVRGLITHQRTCKAIDDEWVDPNDLESGWDLQECWKGQAKNEPQPKDAKGRLIPANNPRGDNRPYDGFALSVSHTRSVLGDSC